MLKAIHENGEIVSLFHFEKREIDAFRLKRFTCPCCNEVVIIRAGPYTVPHFAHKPKSVCAMNEGGEGSYHEKGKLQLFKWFENQGYQVEVEKYLSEIKQRPDLLLAIGTKRIAIEYQCATIPSSDLIKRSNGYRRIGVIPIWILGGNRFKRMGSFKLKLSSMDFHAFYQKSAYTSPLLLFYCSITESFYCLSTPYVISSQLLLGKINHLKKSQIEWRDCFNQKGISQQELFNHWCHIKKKFRTRIIFKKGLIEKKWREWLYSNQLHESLLPSIIYLPISSRSHMMYPPWAWQGQLVIDFLCKQPFHKAFSLQDIIRKASSNRFSFLHPTLLPFIKEYLNLLVKLNVLKKLNDETFCVKSEIKFPLSVPEALEQDRAIYITMSSERNIWV